MVLPTQTIPENNQQQQQPSTSSPDEIQVSAANVDAMRTYISFNPQTHSEMEVVLKQICESVPGISQHAQLIFAFIESVSHFYRTFMNLNSNVTERPLDLSYQRHAIRPELHETLRQACNELFDHGTEAALRESRLATKFLDTVCLIINSSDENGVDAPMSNAAETLSSAASISSFSSTYLPPTINERIDLLLRNWREFTVKYQALIEAFQRISYLPPGVNSPHPLSSAPAVLTTPSATFTSNARCLPPPLLLTPAPPIPYHPSWNSTYPRYEHSVHSLPSLVPPPHMSIDSDDGLFVLSLAARSIASHDTPEIGPLNVDVNSPPTETVAIPHAHSDVGPRVTDCTQPPPPPPPTPGPSTSPTPVGPSRTQSVSSELNRSQNLFENSTNIWPTSNFASDALITLSLGISGSATPFTTPNELQSNNESPYFQGHQPALQSENSGAEHPGVQQNMDNIDPNTMLFILAAADSQSPSTSSMATVDTTQTPPHRLPTRDKKSRPKSRRSQQQQSKSQRQQEESLKTPRTSTPQTERPLISGTTERSIAIIDEVDGAICQNTLSTSPTSKDIPPQGKFLKLSDLRDKLRILVVEDNKLRRATVFTYTERNQEDAPTTSSTTDKNPYNRVWRIHLDPLDDSDDSKRRRCTEEDFQAWALLQKAVLYVSPESPDQLVPGTRVCAIWSARLGNVYFPGRITDFPSIESANNDETTFSIQFDDGDSTLVPFRSILLLPNDYKNPKGPCPLPNGRRRLRSPLVSPDSISVCPAEGSGRNSRIGSDEGKTEMPILMPNGGSGDKPDVNMPIKLPIPKVIWTPIGQPLKTRCKGMVCYEAFQRNVDNLVVRLNDTVTFMTAQSSEMYLGRINQIYSTKRNIFKVTAHWLYTPSEMGQAGKIVANYEGAVFTSNHFDDNEAFCISGPIRVAYSYSEFLAATAGLKRRRISTTLSSIETTSTSASTRKRRRLTILDDSDEESDRSSSGDEYANEDIPRYFIAGEYDFKECRVVSWDKDLAKELHLPASDNHS